MRKRREALTRTATARLTSRLEIAFQELERLQLILAYLEVLGIVRACWNNS